ncbi:DUF1127 domain-containing protein [Methylobacterium marchantiae]|uniref:DUF1127 domain-containing protein n=1 Tax=Methylobacterium marchantiae TaxID=600331 RepID=A0ABW3X0T1_9HYPH|nr:hypothetical protein AIGOOFII_3993 [Methylobacterium marchantiae]
MVLTPFSHTKSRIMNSTLNWTPGDSAAEQVTQATRLIGRLFSKAASVVSRQDDDRRGLDELGSLSERELNDIGLTRWDVLDAAEATSPAEASKIILAHRAVRQVSRRLA